VAQAALVGEWVSGTGGSSLWRARTNYVRAGGAVKLEGKALPLRRRAPSTIVAALRSCGGADLDAVAGSPMMQQVAGSRSWSKQANSGGGDPTVVSTCWRQGLATANACGGTVAGARRRLESGGGRGAQMGLAGSTNGLYGLHRWAHHFFGFLLISRGGNINCLDGTMI